MFFCFPFFLISFFLFEIFFLGFFLFLFFYIFSLFVFFCFSFFFIKKIFSSWLLASPPALRSDAVLDFRFLPRLRSAQEVANVGLNFLPHCVLQILFRCAGTFTRTLGYQDIPMLCIHRVVFPYSAADQEGKAN